MKWPYAQAYVEALSRRPMALHVRHDFWYISPTFSAKKKKRHKISKVRSSESCFLCES